MSADELERPRSSGEHQEAPHISKPTGVESPGIFRRLPIVCFFIALIYFLIGRLRFPKRFVSRAFEIDEDQVFTVFRHMKRTTKREHSHVGAVVLVVRFRFARFAQAVNRRLSLFPIPLITGFPGFHEKIWMVNEENGEWLGLYEWETERVAKDYEKSFVLRLMTRRAEEGSVSLRIIRDASVSGYLQQKDRSISQ